MPLLKLLTYGGVYGGIYGSDTPALPETTQTRGSCTPHSSDNLLGSEVRDAQVCPRPLASDGQAWAGVLLLSCSTWVPWPDSPPRAVVKWAA